jgi:hypothetical protein
VGSEGNEDGRMMSDERERLEDVATKNAKRHEKEEKELYSQEFSLWPR